MAEEEPQFYRQFLRSRTENGQEIVREVVSPNLLDADAAAAAETQAGRSFQGFVAPGDMNALGAQPAAPSPQAAPPPTPGFVRQTLLPERTLTSEVPSIALGTAGGIAGGLTGPFASIAAPALAAAGSGLGEAGQVGLEHVMGWPPAEPGTLGERVQRAAIRGGAFEAATIPFRMGAKIIGHTAGPTLKAAEEVAPVLKQNLPEGAALLERGIAEIAPAGADQPTLLRAWWQEQAPKGAAAVTAAWDAMTPAQQAFLAGGQREAMQTVVNTIRTGAEKIPFSEWARLGGRGTVMGGLPAYLGHPELAATLATVPQVMSVARTVAPKVAGPMLLNPTGSQVLGWLPQAARAAGPWASGLLSGGAQLGGAYVDEGPVAFAPPYAPPG
ncbi:MAG TPA: hypothetical protein VLK79_12760 [Gaiellales bacterium]|nr:hypothetical protein [Gaiellales bacterium]